MPAPALPYLSSRPVAALCAPSYFPHQSDLGFETIKGRSFPSYPVVEELSSCLYPALKLHFMITGQQIKAGSPKDSFSPSWILAYCLMSIFV